jgi:hypothetical protein
VWGRKEGKERERNGREGKGKKRKKVLGKDRPSVFQLAVFPHFPNFSVLFL